MYTRTQKFECTYMPTIYAIFPGNPEQPRPCSMHVQRGIRLHIGVYLYVCLSVRVCVRVCVSLSKHSTHRSSLRRAASLHPPVPQFCPCLQTAKTRLPTRGAPVPAAMMLRILSVVASATRAVPPCEDHVCSTVE